MFLKNAQIAVKKTPKRKTFEVGKNQSTLLDSIQKKIKTDDNISPPPSMPDEYMADCDIPIPPPIDGVPKSSCGKSIGLVPKRVVKTSESRENEINERNKIIYERLLTMGDGNHWMDHGLDNLEKAKARMDVQKKTEKEKKGPEKEESPVRIPCINGAGIYQIHPPWLSEGRYVFKGNKLEFQVYSMRHSGNEIQCIGRTQREESVCLRVKNCSFYFYIRTPIIYTPDQIIRFWTVFRKEATNFIVKSRRMYPGYVPEANPKYFGEFERVMAKPLYEYSEKQVSFTKIRVTTPSVIRKLQEFLENPMGSDDGVIPCWLPEDLRPKDPVAWKDAMGGSYFGVSEANVDPVLRFTIDKKLHGTVDNKIHGTGWITCEGFLVENNRISMCDIEMIADSHNTR